MVESTKLVIPPKPRWFAVAIFLLFLRDDEWENKVVNMPVRALKKEDAENIGFALFHQMAYDEKTELHHIADVTVYPWYTHAVEFPVAISDYFEIKMGYAEKKPSAEDATKVVKDNVTPLFPGKKDDPGDPPKKPRT